MALPLPQELIDQTITFVPDNKTLRNCSRICRAWTQAAQGRIFQNIIIRYKHHADKFLELLKSSPHIAKYPRLLLVHEGRGRRYQQEQKYVEDFLIEMASRLVDVGVLKIWGTDMRGFSERSAQILCEGFPRVEQLCFAQTELDSVWILSFLHTHSYIRQLSFADGSIQPSEVPSFRPRPAVPYLHTLEISYTSGIRLILPFLCMQGDNQSPPSITQLHFTPLSDADEAAGRQFLLEVKDTLRELVLCISSTPFQSRREECRAIIERFPLKYLSALTTFVADCIILSSSFPDTYCWVQQALWDLRQVPLETVVIRMFHLSDNTAQNFDWARFMSTLLELGHVRFLRFELWGSKTRATMSEIIRKEMPGLEDRAWHVEFFGRT